jgi:hypothetical protein
MFTLQTSPQPLLLGGGGGGSIGDCEWQGGTRLKLLSQLRPRIRPLDS